MSPSASEPLARVECPNCEQPGRVTLGERVKCTHCQHVFAVPTDAELDTALETRSLMLGQIRDFLDGK